MPCDDDRMPRDGKVVYYRNIDHIWTIGNELLKSDVLHLGTLRCPGVSLLAHSAALVYPTHGIFERANE